MDFKALTLAGLTDNEARVYETLVKFGKLKASKLASLSNIHRTNAYDSAERLVQKGFATKLKLGKFTFYAPVSPSVLEEHFKKLSVGFVYELKELRSYFGKNIQAISAATYEGKLGFQSLLLDIIETCKPGDTWYSFSAPGFAKSVIGDVFVAKFHKQRIAKGIKLVALFADNAAARKRAAELAKLPLVEAYFLPSGFFSPLGMWIYGDKVAINGYLEPVFSVVIQNKQFADVYRNYINIVKKKSKQFP